MITSRQNALVKEVRKLIGEKKYRDQTGLFVCEGVKLVKEAISLGLQVEKLCLTAKHEACFQDFEDGRKELFSDDLFEYMSSEVTPQGVLAIVKKPLVCSPDGSDAILLDGVSDPANVGAISRTAVCAGYTDLFLINSADPYSPKSVRASMGGVFRNHFHYIEREEVDKIGLPLVVADMKGQNAFEINLKENVCLVIGNEGNGVSKEIKEKADYLVSIPMQNGMESLNASVSAGILMYSVKNSRKGE